MKLVIRHWPAAGKWWWGVAVDPEAFLWNLTHQGTRDTWSEALAVGLAALEQRALLNAADDEKDEPVTTLPEFLLARIDEDQAVAIAAQVDPVAAWSAQDWVEIDDSSRDHAGRWNPVRVLAECQAKRRIVKLHQVVYRGRHADCVLCHLPSTDVEREPWDWPCETLRSLALPYDDHADYREEWRP